MHATIDTNDSTSTTTTERSTGWLDSHRATAAAGFGFVATVVAQNVIRAGAPAVDAPVADITDFYATHRATEWALVVLAVIGTACITRFVGGLWSRVEPHSRTWARTGAFGVAGILALFSAMLACEIGLLVAGDSPDMAGTVMPLWLLHNSVFAVLTTFIAVALFGLSRASAAAGLIGPKVTKVATAGAALLAASTVLAPINVDRVTPLMAVGVIGFAGWVTFIVAVSLRLRRA